MEINLDSETSSKWAPGIDGSVHKSTVASPIVDPVEIRSYRHGAEFPAETPNYGEKLLWARFIEPLTPCQQKEGAWTGNGRRRLGPKSERDGRQVVRTSYGLAVQIIHTRVHKRSHDLVIV